MSQLTFKFPFSVCKISASVIVSIAEFSKVIKSLIDSEGLEHEQKKIKKYKIERIF